MTYAAITGWGKCMPPAVLTNADLATFLETDDEWITSRTGIRERRVSHVALEELAYVAARRALACAALDPAEIDLIVFGTCSFDDQVPNQASGLQLRHGAKQAASMDVNTACTSLKYGLTPATAMIRTGVVRNALVIGGEVISEYMLCGLSDGTHPGGDIRLWGSTGAYGERSTPVKAGGKVRRSVIPH